MNGEDILNDLFGQTHIPLGQQNQQNSYVHPPHTPSNRVATETSTVASGSASSHEGEIGHSHLRSGGQIAADNIRVHDKFDQPITMANSGIHGNANRNYAEPNHQFTSTAPAFYTGGLRPPEQQQKQHQLHTTNDAMPPQGMKQFSDAYLQLATCLSDCNVKAMQLLQVAQASFSPTSPVLALLQPIVSHLNRDLNTLMELRSALVTNTATTHMPPSSFQSAVPRVDSRDPLFSHTMISTPTSESPHQHHHHPQQLQQQLQQPLPQALPQSAYPPPFAKGKGLSVGGDPAAHGSAGGIWCMPETRARPAAEAAAAAAALPPFYDPLAPSPSQSQSQSQSPSQLQPSSSSLGAAEEAPGRDDANAVAEAAQGQQGHAASGALSPISAENTAGPVNTKCLAFVEFKRKRVRKYECDVDIVPGTYVIVDGDRGKDCGLIVQTIKTEPDGSTVAACMDCTNVNADKIKLEKGRVLNVASNEEIDLLHNIIPYAERRALDKCKKMCSEMGISIQLIDCEYQFDMEKVSFYFNSEHSVDFRPLVRELYRAFHVRIWMENTNPNVKNAMPISESSADANGGGYNNNGDEMKGDMASLNDYINSQSNNKGSGVGNGRDGANTAKNGGGGRGSGRGRRNKHKA